MHQKNSNRTYPSKTYEDIIAWIITCSLFLIPLVFSWQIMESFYLPKRFLLNMSVSVIICLHLFKILNNIHKNNYLNIKIPPGTVWGILFIFWIFLTIFKSPNMRISVDSFLFWTFNIILYFSVINTINNDNKFNRILNTVVFAAIIVSILGIFQYYGFDLKNTFTFNQKQLTGNKYSVFSTLGHPNFMASYLISVLPVCAMLWYTSVGYKKVCCLIGTLAILYCIYISRSKGGWLGLIVSSLLLFIYLFRVDFKEKKKNIKKIFISLLIILSILLSVFFINLKIKGRSPLIEVKKTLSLNFGANKARLIIWQTTMAMVKDHPIAGFGIGAYNLYYQKYQGNFLHNSNTLDYYLDAYRPGKDAHNDYLQLLTETGIIGLSLFLYILIFFFKTSMYNLKNIKDKNKQKVCVSILCGIIAILTHSLVSFPLQQIPPMIIMWVFMGLIISAIVREEEGDERHVKETLVNKDIIINRSLLLPFKITALIICGYYILSQGGKIYASSLHLTAHNKMLKKNYPKVIKIIKSALYWYPDNADLHLILGTAFHRVKQYKNAEKEYALSFSINPDYMILYNLGLLQEQLGNTNQAKKYYLEAILLHPDLEEGYKQLSEIYKTEGDKQNYLKYNTKWMKYAYKRLRSKGKYPPIGMR